MSLRLVLLAAAALMLAAPATAKEKVKHKYKHKQVERTCVCTMGGHGPGVAPVAPIPPVPAIPAVPHGAWQMHMPHAGAANVTVYRDDGDERVVIVRKHNKRFRDSADENNDGEVSRREFMKRAEKHFKERDKNGNGRLDRDELEPMHFEIPMPPEPPEPPEPDDE